MMSKGERLKIPNDIQDLAIYDIAEKMIKRIDKKGDHSYIGNHEALGVITEEYWEYIEAVKSNDNQAVYEELLDIAVGCVWAIASMKVHNGDQ